MKLILSILLLFWNDDPEHIVFISDNERLAVLLKMKLQQFHVLSDKKISECLPFFRAAAV